MKILVISGFATTTPPVDYGGLEWVVAMEVEGLAKRGHDVTVVASEGSKVNGCKMFTPVKPMWTSEVEEQAFKRYSEIIEEFDIVHDHTHWKHILTRKFKTPIVSTFHDWYGCSSPPPHHAETYTCPSKAHSNHISSIIGKEVLTVYHGIPVEQYPYREEKEDFILFLGRITPYKGAHLAIQIAKKTREKLVIAGEDQNVESHSYVWKIMLECQKHGYKYLGRISNKRKMELLGRAKTLILPYIEPYKCVFELVIVESMACGTPVIITNRNSAEREIIVNGETGYIAENIDEIAQKLRRINEINPKQCRKHVENNFNKQKMATQYEKIFIRVTS